MWIFPPRISTSRTLEMSFVDIFVYVRGENVDISSYFLRSYILPSR